MIARFAGADYGAVLKAMKHHYPRAAKIPGPGFSAGPCLFKDTMQLVAFARNQFALGCFLPAQVNEGLILCLVEELRSSSAISPKATVGLLGMSKV